MPSQSAAGTMPSYTRESPAAFAESVALLSFTAVESFATALAFPFLLLLQLAKRAATAKIIRIFFIRFIFLVAAKVSYFHEKAKDNRIFFFD